MPIVGATVAATIATIATVNAVPASNGGEAAVVLMAASDLGKCGSVLNLRGGLGQALKPPLKLILSDRVRCAPASSDPSC
jgi:hypothetical protein